MILNIEITLTHDASRMTRPMAAGTMKVKMPVLLYSMARDSPTAPAMCNKDLFLARELEEVHITSFPVEPLESAHSLGLVRQPSHGEHGDPETHGGAVVVAELQHAVLHQAEREHVLKKQELTFVIGCIGCSMNV